MFGSLGGSDSVDIGETIKTVFHGYTAIAAFSLVTGPRSFTGAALTLPVLLSISYVSAEMAEMMDDNWSDVLESLAVAGLLISIFVAPALIVLF